MELRSRFTTSCSLSADSFPATTRWKTPTAAPRLPGTQLDARHAPHGPSGSHPPRLPGLPRTQGLGQASPERQMPRKQKTKQHATKIQRSSRFRTFPATGLARIVELPHFVAVICDQVQQVEGLVAGIHADISLTRNTKATCNQPKTEISQAVLTSQRPQGACRAQCLPSQARLVCHDVAAAQPAQIAKPRLFGTFTRLFLVVGQLLRSILLILDRQQCLRSKREPLNSARISRRLFGLLVISCSSASYASESGARRFNGAV